MGVVLSGASNDKETLVSAVRMAAREGAKLRVVLAPGCGRQDAEKHLDFALWDVQARLHLEPPEIAVESRLPDLELAMYEASGDVPPAQAAAHRAS